MIIYVLLDNIKDDCKEFYGAYSSYELAKSRLDIFEYAYQKYFEIIEYELDSE